MIDALRLRAHLLTLYRSTTLRVTLTFGFAGIANILGNLLLARQLLPLEFAAVALFLAFTQVGTILGMAGADATVVRHGLTPTWRLLGTLTGFSVLVGAVVGYVSYDVGMSLAVITFLSIVASAIVVWTPIRSRQNFRAALFLHQSYTFVLLAVAVLALFAGTQGAVVPIVLMTACFFVTAAWGWRTAVRSYSAP